MIPGSATLSDITSADWSLMLDATAAQDNLGTQPGAGIGNVVQGVDDVNQCIAIILGTPRGSDVLRPTFGADLWKYIDMPVNAAIPNIVREVTDAITRWEPRVTLLSVTAGLVNPDATSNVNAHMQITIVWQLKLSAPVSAAQAQTTTITIPGNLS